MKFKLKWTFIILIVHSRLHNIKSTTLTDRYKPTFSDNSSINKTNHISFNDGITKINNKNNEQIFDNIFFEPNTKTNNQQTPVADALNKAIVRSPPTLEQQQSKQVHNTNVEDNINGSSVSSDNNIFGNDKNLSDTSKVESANNRTSEVVNAFNATLRVPDTERYYNKNDVTENEKSNESVEATIVKTNEENDQLKDIWEDVLNDVDLEDFEYFVHKYNASKHNKCIMHGLKEKIQWWANNNGTLNKDFFQNKRAMSDSNGEDYLDLSYNNITNDELLSFNTWLTKLSRKITNYSAAYNNLTQVPYRTLSLMAESLKRLNLRGNYFITIKSPKRYPSDSENMHHENNYDSLNSRKSGIETSENFKQHADQRGKLIDEAILYNLDTVATWATFPKMPVLIELDISDCSIEFIERDVFVNITGIRKLYMSRNNFHFIPHNTFHLLPELEYLDLAYTQLHTLHTPTKTLLGGVKIQANTFKYLKKLIYLDVSHAKLGHNSALAFRNLGSSLQYLSLCYTFFPITGQAIFNDTALVGLDLSGNPFLPRADDPFEGLADTLKYFFLEESNLKSLGWLKKLKNLNLLSLRGNYINDLSSHVFGYMHNLSVLDLSDNLIGNWYAQIFRNNTKLRLLNMRHNNLNMINSVMVKDFSTLAYLSLGDNNFLCDCVLRDLMEIATINNKKAECLNNLLETPAAIVNVDDVAQRTRSTTLNVSELDALLATHSLQRYAQPLETSFKNLRSSEFNVRFPRMRYIARNGLSVLRTTFEDTSECGTILSGKNSLNGTLLKFQLMDYDNGYYWCFNGTNRIDFVELDCDFDPLRIDITESINHLTRIVVISICSIMTVASLMVIVYFKRWHIYYYYSSLKSAALLSVATKDQVKKFNELSENDPNMVYDIFISYCQSDREWVLKELLPNVEQVENISICLHERDFEIGVAILDNIISCMDRSRALMLIISSNFLLSHWCQFEMHLAQHRIFEVSKEHLIVVFLEDIPRAKRPKALQYLMEVKTYIKWPGAKGREVSPEERKCFWKRMRNSLYKIGISPAETNV